MKLFGTDGLRALAGEYPLDNATLELLGTLLCIHFRDKGYETELIVGQDTRESGEAIFSALKKGFCNAGGRIDHAGIISTPALAYIAKREKKCATAITASHNPYRDNGIKIFGPDGIKLSEDSEAWIEPFLLGEKSLSGQKPPDSAGENREMQNYFHEEYCNHLLTDLFSDLDLSGMRIAIDCANGALYQIAPEVLRQLGATVTAFYTEPNGRNINEHCGALYPEVLQAEIKSVDDFDCGFTFDGDGDRCLPVDKRGIYDGDFVLAAAGMYLKKLGRLKKDAIVATIMSNIGLEVFLQKNGIQLYRVPVGDKNVLDRLLKEELSLGGEQSGHIIFLNDSLIGDGLMTALQLLRIMRQTQRPLADLCPGFTRFPQTLLNIKVLRKPDFDSIPEIASAARDVEKQLVGEGRLLLRYSGTEMLARIMIEGPDQQRIEQMANSLGEIVRSKLN